MLVDTDDFIIHEDYILDSFGVFNDIALIKLPEPVEFSGKNDSATHCDTISKTSFLRLIWPRKSLFPEKKRRSSAGESWIRSSGRKATS